ncbi:hypothetical protein PAXINDRAFT_173145, partial [Paxillus involutus ATCC 200175]
NGLNNVPGAVSELKVRLVWVQVPSENGVHLELIHRFQVEMEHNWYETTVTASLPHRIVSVVDWTSDSPMPLPVATEEGKYPMSSPAWFELTLGPTSSVYHGF